MIFIRVSLFEQSAEVLRRFEATVRSIKNITECYLIAGDYDYLMKIEGAGSDNYPNMHKEIITKLPGVHRVRSDFPIRAVLKPGSKRAFAKPASTDHGRH